MFDPLDSRALRRTDCYAQRFMKAGTYRYNVLPTFTDWIHREWPFTIKVVEESKETAMSQHNIVVRLEKRNFGVDPSEIVIKMGDLVLWNFPQAGDIPYCIVGEKEFFASSRMFNECGYSHAFGLSGEYRWRDAYGSKVHGIVRVHDPQCKEPSEFGKWHEILNVGTVVMIESGEAKPASVEILTGQTVFFAVTKTHGITITDERLLASK